MEKRCNKNNLGQATNDGGWGIKFFTKDYSNMEPRLKFQPGESNIYSLLDNVG